jgi:hypothetical protein
MDSVANLLNFSTPTQTHNFYHESNGYGCLKMAHVRSFSGLLEIRFFDGF